MPRPKSEITKAGKTIGVRLTPNEYEAYVSLGGIKWIRETLRAYKKEMVKEAHQKSPPSLKEKA